MQSRPLYLYPVVTWKRLINFNLQVNRSVRRGFITGKVGIGSSTSTSWSNNVAQSPRLASPSGSGSGLHLLLEECHSRNVCVTSVRRISASQLLKCPEKGPEKDRMSEGTAAKNDKSKVLRAKTPIGKLDELGDGPHPYQEKEPLPPWPENTNPHTGEVGGPKGPEPTRYGDWERKGRVSDF